MAGPPLRPLGPTTTTTGTPEGPGATWRVAKRIETGTVACRYAGAMLVHAFTDPDRARALLTAGTGASAAGAGAPVDDLGILVCTQLSFTLGALTLEQAKHLTAADAGALAGLDVPALPADLAGTPGRARRHMRPAGAAAPPGQPDARHRARRVAGLPGR